MDDQRTSREGGRASALGCVLAISIGILAVAAGLFAARDFFLPMAPPDETIRRGDVIIQALNKYRVDHGDYPATLAELSPQYLETIPLPDWGLQEWKYNSRNAWRPGTAEFYLGVDETKRTGDGDSHWLRWAGEKHGWQIGD